jgi:ABC-type proline/glycine betaine transport system ATPase subunit
MIQFEKVSKSFTRGSPVVDDFSLMVPEGRFVVLLGPSGSGKSTLLNLIAGLAQPEAGTICIDGKNMAGIPPHKRNCSMAFQNGICYDHWTVEKNIRSAAPTTSRVIIDEIIDRLGLRALESRYPCEISGGESHRVSLARALVSPKPILLLDEPLAQLNPALRFQTREIIRELHRKWKKTTVYVTHDLEEAASLADLIVVVNEGKLIQQGSMREILRSPRNETLDCLYYGHFHSSDVRYPVMPHRWCLKGIGPEEVVIRLQEERSPSEPKGLLIRLQDCHWLGDLWELIATPLLGQFSSTRSVPPMVLRIPDSDLLSRQLASQLEELESKDHVELCAWVIER